MCVRVCAHVDTQAHVFLSLLVLCSSPGTARRSAADGWGGAVVRFLDWGTGKSVPGSAESWPSLDGLGKSHCLTSA